ncbi:cyclic-di-AMP receptor, partial [Bacillus sp. WP8]|uniref:cyclic-di-AMP receptor n=1 Tax=Bacillus sp. WP8 TaxID=756828 RepID=UPI0021B25A5E
MLPLLHHQHTTNFFKIFTQHHFPLTKLPSTPPFLNSPNTTFIIPSHHLPLHKPLHLIKQNSRKPHQMIPPLSPMPPNPHSYLPYPVEV